MPLAVLRRTVWFAVAVSAVFMTACGSTVTSPGSPTSTVRSTETVPTTSSSPPSTGLSPFIGTWNVSLALTEVAPGSGTGGCVADALNSQVGVPRDYTLTVTARDVTLTDPSNSLACVFETVKGGDTGFTTQNVRGYFYCTGKLPVRCADGSVHELMWFAQDITATVAGTEISGTWWALWGSWDEPIDVNLTSQFKGRKQ